jgi:hypothetical protein
MFRNGRGTRSWLPMSQCPPWRKRTLPSGKGLAATGPGRGFSKGPWHFAATVRLLCWRMPLREGCDDFAAAFFTSQHRQLYLNYVAES